jgi:hypothetical protein
MLDIVDVEDDIQLFDTQVGRAANILGVQRGALTYAETLGIDLRFFLSEEFRFQNDSFKAYCIEVLAYKGINVSSVTETIESLFRQLTFEISAEETTTALISR